MSSEQLKQLEAKILETEQNEAAVLPVLTFRIIMIQFNLRTS